MDTLLIIVTAISLALAAGMSVVGWMLLRDERGRSAARVEALETLAAAEPAAGAVERSVEALPEDVESEASADWDAGREAWDATLHERPSAPPSPPGAVSGDETPPPAFLLRPEPARPDRTAPRSGGLRSSTAAIGPMFETAADAGAPTRRWVAVAATVLVMCGGAALAYGFGTGRVGAAMREAAGAANPGPQPLELLSLRHAADPDGSFTVTGLVENPAGGQAIRNAVAVVYLFDMNGNYFATGRTSLDTPTLEPGNESPFTIHVPNAMAVSRYRVGFRRDDGSVIAHVDKRGQPPGGTTGDGVDADRPHTSAAPASSSDMAEGQS